MASVSTFHRPPPTPADHPEPRPTIDLDTLIARIDREGIEAVEATALAAVAERARRAGLSPDLADALVDPTTPTVVRLRIVGRAAVVLAGTSAGPRGHDRGHHRPRRRGSAIAA